MRSLRGAYLCVTVRFWNIHTRKLMLTFLEWSFAFVEFLIETLRICPFVKNMFSSRRRSSCVPISIRHSIHMVVRFPPAAGTLRRWFTPHDVHRDPPPYDDAHARKRVTLCSAHQMLPKPPQHYVRVEYGKRKRERERDEYNAGARGYSCETRFSQWTEPERYGADRRRSLLMIFSLRKSTHIPNIYIYTHGHVRYIYERI